MGSEVRFLWREGGEPGFVVGEVYVGHPNGIERFSIITNSSVSRRGLPGDYSLEIRRAGSTGGVGGLGWLAGGRELENPMALWRS